MQSLFRQMGRRKSEFDSTAQPAIQQHVVEHVEHNEAKRSYGHPLHPDLTPDVLICVLPPGTVSPGRESEVESAHLFLTLIQFSAHVILLLNTQAFAYTTQSYHIHLQTTKVLWRWASGEAVGVGYAGSCSCRPAHRRLSSIWSFSVRRCSQRNSAVD